MINYVMLTWNRKAFVKEFFKSFYKNVENQKFVLYIIDNGSTDGSAELLKELALKDERINLTLNQSNKGLEEYKKLFDNALNQSKSDFVIILDDDVIQFPEKFDTKLINGMNQFKEIGYLALDVVQDERTNGAKPALNHYKLIKKGNISIDFGPAGGWCAIVRTKDLRKINFFVKLRRLSMKSGEDSTLVWFLRKLLRKKTGILKNEFCLHATGPYYSKKYNFLERDIEKYDKSGLFELRDIYISYRDQDAL